MIVSIDTSYYKIRISLSKAVVHSSLGYSKIAGQWNIEHLWYSFFWSHLFWPGQKKNVPELVTFAQNPSS